MRSVLVPWGGPPLRSRQRCAARVRVWGSDGGESAWSTPTEIEAGLLGTADWTARFITPDWDEDTSQAQPCPLLRREFTARGPVERARLYVSALGVYEIEINGMRVGDEMFAPGWTSYSHRLRYETFDVTALLREGANAIGAILGDGWYRGLFGFGGGRRNIYGDGWRCSLSSKSRTPTARWMSSRATDRGARQPARRWHPTSTTARRTTRDWSATAGPAPVTTTHDWSGVRILEQDLSALVAPVGPPVRRTEELHPKAIITSPSGRTILDFGQNLVGRAAHPGRRSRRLDDHAASRGGAGGRRAVHAAAAQRGGDRPLHDRAARGVETWEPRFTFHGFRYAEVDGWPGRARCRRHRRAWSATPTWSAPAGSSAPTDE